MGGIGKAAILFACQALFALMLATEALSIPAPPSTIKNGLEHDQAIEFLKRSEFGKAAELEKGVIARDPEDLTARFILAIACLGLEDEKAAVEQAHSAAGIDPGFAAEIYGAMGRYYITKRRFHKALLYLREGLKIKDDPAMIRHVAAIYLGQGLLKNAREYYERLLEHEPDYLNLSRIHLAEADLPKAIEYAKEALKADPRATGAHLVLGTAYLMNGSHDDAYSNFLILRQTNPEFFLTSYFIGLIKMLQDDPAGAFESFSALVTLTPRLREGYLNAAAALHMKKDHARAAEMARKAIEEDPIDPVAHLALANILVSMKDFAAADAEFRKASDIFAEAGLKGFSSSEYFKDSPDAPARLTFAVLLNRAGLYRDAVRVAGAYDNELLRIVKARAEEKLGELDAAEREYRSLVEERPGLVSAHIGMAEISEARSDTKKAIERYDNAASRAPALIKIRLKLGELHARAGATEKAIAEYSKASELSPESAPVYKRLSELYAEQGDMEKALGYALKGRSANPVDIDLGAVTGWLYYRLGRYKDALESYSVIEKNGTEDPVAYWRLGLVYERLNRPDKAAAAIEKALNINDEFPGSGEAKAMLLRLNGLG